MQQKQSKRFFSSQWNCCRRNTVLKDSHPSCDHYLDPEDSNPNSSSNSFSTGNDVSVCCIWFKRLTQLFLWLTGKLSQSVPTTLHQSPWPDPFGWLGIEDQLSHLRIHWTQLPTSKKLEKCHLTDLISQQNTLQSYRQQSMHAHYMLQLWW